MRAKSYTVWSQRTSHSSLPSESKCKSSSTYVDYAHPLATGPLLFANHLRTCAFVHRNNRYDALRACVGEDLCQKLADLRIFMVSTQFLSSVPVENSNPGNVSHVALCIVL